MYCSRKNEQIKETRLQEKQWKLCLYRRYRRLFHLVYESELVRSVGLVHYNVCMPDIHQLVYQRIYADEIESLQKETFPYCHISFMLTPEVQCS